ncbi:MAG TPA: fatty acid desaturase [Sandaracinaceae bacterium]
MTTQSVSDTSHDPWASPPPLPIERRELRKLQQRSDVPALLHLAGHLSLAGVTGLLIYVSLGTWWLMIPAMFAHGIVLVMLFACMHECTHGTAFRRRWLNNVVGFFCGFVLWRSSLYFKYRHADHHTYTQDPERDPDLVPMPSNFRLYFAEIPPAPRRGTGARPRGSRARGRVPRAGARCCRAPRARRGP